MSGTDAGTSGRSLPLADQQGTDGSSAGDVSEGEVRPSVISKITTRRTVEVAGIVASILYLVLSIYYERFYSSLGIDRSQ